MHIKKVIKRLMALGAGATMLGATVMGAMAVDLSSYPDKYQTDGVFNGYFVVGEAAKPIDNLAMTDIATSMWYTKPSKVTTTTLTGDTWKVGTSTKALEMANTNSTPQGEQIRDIETWISKDELKALGDGTYKTNAGDYAYAQYIYFDVKNDDTNEIVVYRENEDYVTADFFYVKNGANIGQYKLEFSSIPESTIKVASTGSVSATGEQLDDFESTKLTMLGVEYDIVLARRPTPANSDNIKLTLMGGATSGNLLEMETKTFDLKGTSYEVTLSYTDSTYAKFTVNGESTTKLQVGDTYKLKDGKEIGISELLYQAYAGGVHSAKFFLGASKMELRDDNIRDTDTSNELVVGSDTIDGAAVIITGTDNNVTFTLNTIAINITAEDDYYVPANGKLSAAITEQDDEKEMLFTNNWEIEYLGLETADSHDIKLDSSTDRKYKLQFYDGAGNQVDMPLFYAVDSTNITMTEDATDKEVIINEGMNISKDDYFVLTQGTASSGTAKTFVLQYKGADKSTSTSPKVKFKDLGSGETLEYALDTAGTAVGSATCTIKLGGYSWNVKNQEVETGSDFLVNVDLDGSGEYDNDNEIDIIDAYGLQIDFGNTFKDGNAGNQVVNPLLTNRTSVALTLTTPNLNDYDTQVPATIRITADATTTNEVTVSTFAVDGVDHSLTPEGEENIGYGYTTMGAKWTYTSPTGSPNEFTYNYPKLQRLPQVYVTGGATTTSATTGGELALVQVVDATKLDTEIADIGAQNLIVVGGPCVNSVAAKLLGNPADCTEGFSPGKARIKMFEDATSKKLAMLVAGYSGEDTRLGGKVVSHRYKELKGEEVEVAGTTYSDATIGAPTVVVAAETTTAATE